MGHFDARIDFWMIQINSGTNLVQKSAGIRIALKHSIKHRIKHRIRLKSKTFNGSCILIKKKINPLHIASKGFLLLLSSSLITSCAFNRTSEKNLDQKIETQTSAKNSSGLVGLSSQMIDNIPNITATQKQKLSDLQKQTKKQMDEYTKESLSLREVLIKDVLSQDYNGKEVSLIKERLRKLEIARLNKIFAAADRANEILGRSTPQHAELMNSFFELHGIDRN
jgi:hypothetical protein